MKRSRANIEALCLLSKSVCMWELERRNKFWRVPWNIVPIRLSPLPLLMKHQHKPPQYNVFTESLGASNWVILRILFLAEKAHFNCFSWYLYNNVTYQKKWYWASLLQLHTKNSVLTTGTPDQRINDHSSGVKERKKKNKRGFSTAAHNCRAHSMGQIQQESNDCSLKQVQVQQESNDSSLKQHQNTEMLATPSTLKYNFIVEI